MKWAPTGGQVPEDKHMQHQNSTSSTAGAQTYTPILLYKSTGTQGQGYKSQHSLYLISRSKEANCGREDREEQIIQTSFLSGA